MMKRLTILIALCLAGCRSVSERRGDPAWSGAYQRWKQDNSYYALVEIVDAHLANRPDHSRATKQEVLKYLGKPNWGTVNQDPHREWAYQGLGRHVPYGNKVILTFNNKDELIDIGWVSE